jgi:hypothetical protein
MTTFLFQGLHMNLNLPGNTRNESVMDCSPQNTTTPEIPDPKHTTTPKVLSVLISSQV